MVGSAATMRVSSATSPSWMGTLKSTRTSTRRPAGCRSFTLFLRAVATPMKASSGHLEQRVDDAIREACFVVVPREHLDQIAVHHVGGEGVEHAAVRVADHVARDDRIG